MSNSTLTTIEPMDIFTLKVPKTEASFLRTMAKKMGWIIEKKKASKKRLYDPETGDVLNENTMKAIEETIAEQNMTEVKSMDEYLKLVNNL